VQPLWKTVWRFLKKLEIELPHDPAIPVLDIHAKEKKPVYQRDICAPVLTIALNNHNSHNIELNQVYVNE
jgi:hypothetical protein